MRTDPNGAGLRWVSDRHLRWRRDASHPTGAAGSLIGAMGRLRDARIPGLLDLVPARDSILLAFDGAALGDSDATERAVLDALRAPDTPTSGVAPRMVEVPVCYEGEHAPDLEALAALHAMTPREAAALHAGVEHVVEFIGFMPGFPYLTGLPQALETPRLERPRPRVPAGSVAIGADRTGVYPFECPGGWRIIGRTPLRLFDARRDPPSLLRAGDRVRFIPASPERFRALRAHEQP